MTVTLHPYRGEIGHYIGFTFIEQGARVRYLGATPIRWPNARRNVLSLSILAAWGRRTPC